MTESNIYQKIALVILHDATQRISKGKQGYTSDDVYAALRTAMAENNLICIPQFNEHYMQDGTLWVSFTFTLIDADSGDKLESTWYQIVPAANKMMTIDKCIGAASTYAHKYFLMRTFMLTSSDDPMIDGSHDDEQRYDSQADYLEPAQETRAEQAEQIALDTEVKAKKQFLQRLADDPTIRDEQYYPNYQHLVNTLKKYKDEFGNDPLEDGFNKVADNLMTRKENEKATT